MARRKTIYGMDVSTVWAAVSFSVFLCQASAQSDFSYNNRSVECDIGGEEGFGYDSIADLQADIDAERSRIDTNATAPEASYFFQLCANQDFDILNGQELRPTLNNIVIRCGVAGSGNVSDECTFVGNDIQILVQDFEGTDNPVTDVFFRGVTFSGFDEAVLGGNASSITTVRFENSQIAEFDSQSIVVQETDVAAAPFGVVLSSTNVSDGIASNGFVVEQGNLALDNVEVFDVNISGSLISAAGDNAFVSIVESNVLESGITNVVNLQSGADADLTDVEVAEMTFVNRTLLASGRGTEAVIDELRVLSNLNEPQSRSTAWEYVEANTDASVSVSNSQFISNENVLYGFNANNGATLILDNVIADGNSGAAEDEFDAAIVLASENSEITVLDSIFNSTDGITAAFAAFDDSNIDTSRTCLSNLVAQVLAFTQFGSTMDIREDNAVENSPDVAAPGEQICPDDFRRLMVENSTLSNCFLVPGDCSFECENWASFNECALIPLRNATTDSPSQFPSSSPTLSSLPSIQPVTLSPAATAAPSDQPSTVPTSTISPTLSSQPTMIPSSSAPATSTPTEIPSSLPTIVQTVTPTTSVPPTLVPTITSPPTRSASPSRSPSQVPSGFPTTSSHPSSSPSVSASPTTSAAPSRSAAPSSHPSVSSFPSSLPSLQPTTVLPTAIPLSPVPPNTLPPIFGPQPTLPPDRGGTFAPTRCIVRPSKGKGRRGKGKGNRNGSLRKERALGENGYTYVYHYVYVDHSSDKDPADHDESLPFCDDFPTPRPTHAPKYVHSPHYHLKVTKTKSGGKKR